MIIILVCLTLLIGAAFVVWHFVINSDMTSPADKAANLAANTEARSLTADEIVSLTSVLEPVTTNLADQRHVVVVGFAFQLENKKTVDEFEKLKEIRVQPVVLKLLHSTTPQQLFEEKGFDVLTSKLMNEINQILQEGKITQIHITSFVVDRL